VKRIENLSDILRKVLKNRDANQEIAAVIKGGYYSDERVKISDLLNFSQSPAYKTKLYKDLKEKNGIKEGSFKAEYQKQMPQIITMSDSWYFDDLVLYFPYSEMFDLPRNYTLVPGVVETDEWEGWIILDDSETTGIVNDDFAYQNPVLIITSGASTDIRMDCTTNPNWCNDPLDPIPGLNLRRVEVGWICTKTNADNLIGFNKLNSGGNEVVIGRTDGYLRFDTDGHITEFKNMMKFDFTRLDGRNKTWRPVYTMWDPNWVQGNHQQIMNCWEEDAKGTQEWGGKLTTTIKKKIAGAEVQVTGELTYKHTIKSQDKVYSQQPFSWNAYVGASRNPVHPLGYELKPIKNNAFWNYFLFQYANFSSGSAKDKAYLPNGEYWSIVPLGDLANITWPYQIVR
jgi:hypothetical protein